jgi:hypothetical protein
MMTETGIEVTLPGLVGLGVLGGVQAINLCFIINYYSTFILFYFKQLEKYTLAD